MDGTKEKMDSENDTMNMRPSFFRSSSPTNFDRCLARTFRDLTVTNANRVHFRTNSSLFAIFCPLFRKAVDNLPSLIDTEDLTVVVDGLSDAEMSYLDVFLHEGSLIWELTDSEEEDSVKEVSQALSYLMKSESSHLKPTFTKKSVPYGGTSDQVNKYRTVIPNSRKRKLPSPKGPDAKVEHLEVKVEPSMVCPKTEEVKRVEEPPVSELRKLTPSEVAALKLHQRPAVPVPQSKSQVMLKVAYRDQDTTIVSTADNSLKELFYKSQTRCVEGKFECPDCEVLLAPWESFVSHRMIQHILMPCFLCEKRFSKLRAGELLQHWVDEHSAIKYEGDRMAYCNICKGSLKHFPLLSIDQSGYSNVKLISTHFKEHADFLRAPCATCGQRWGLRADEDLIVSWNRMQRHKKLMGNHPRECAFVGCDFKFASWAEHHGHVTSVHQQMLFRCGYCELRVEAKSALDEHLRSDHGVWITRPHEVRCRACGERFESGSELEHHVLEEHLKFTHICDLCDDLEATFISEGGLAKHIKRSHTAECKICSETFSGDVRKDELRAHVRLVHGIQKKKYGEYSEPCVACGAVFRKYNSQSRNHYEKMGPMHDNGCCYGQCGAVFASWRENEEHVEAVHGGRRVFRCGFCGKYFDNAEALSAHNEAEHRESMPKEICDICGKGVGIGTVGMHKKKWHSGTAEETLDYCCEKCGKQFLYKHDFQRHRHDDPRSQKIICEICGVVIDKCSRRSHILTKHTPYDQLPYHCEMCGKRFVTKLKLKKHSSIHENKRQFKCSMCQQGFNDDANRQAHEKKNCPNRMKAIAMGM